MNEPARAMNFIKAEPFPLGGIQVAPMVDIVFQLIGFFMLASQLLQTQKDPSVQLPVMLSTEARQEVPAEITINLRAGGGVTVNGLEVSLEDVGRALAATLAESRGRGTAARVVVRADRRERFDELGRILDACRRQGVEQVIFRARGEP